MTLQKAVVYLGGSTTEVELIQAFRASDIRVVLVDRNADAPGRVFADEFVNLSVTDADSICSALDSFRSRYRFVAAYGIVDYTFKTIRELTEKLSIDLNPPEIYEEFTNKLKTKARLERFNIPTPETVARGRKFDESALQSIVAAGGSGAVVIKANDACNSEGVRIVRVEERDSVREAIHHAIELSEEFFCEEYVSGALLNLDVILSAGRALIVAITDRYRMADGVTSLAGFQQNPRQHPLYGEFEKLAQKIQLMFSDYCGPLTADILVSGDGFKVLEVSPHLHASKLQWLRDPRILGVWPRILSGEALELQSLSESAYASAYLRIYGDDCSYRGYFDSSWITDIETFPLPRHFGSHELRKILYMKAESSDLLRERLEAFVDENGGLPAMGVNHEAHLAASR